MTPHDQHRFADLVSAFIDGCDFDPPLYLIAIGSNGSVSVSRQTCSGLAEVCAFNRGPGTTSPLVIAVVAEDGSGSRSARIEIVAARPTVQ